jgi:hypothetical protein
MPQYGHGLNISASALKESFLHSGQVSLNIKFALQRLLLLFLKHLFYTLVFLYNELNVFSITRKIEFSAQKGLDILKL